MRKQENAYLTVYLALCITLILSLCLTLIEGARRNGARSVYRVYWQNTTGNFSINIIYLQWTHLTAPICPVKSTQKNIWNII